jgi:mannose-6-phosphate isomerase class I
MANSDNVVRAGFTSKFKDASTLLSIMSTTMGEVGRVNPKVEEGKSYSIKRYVT